MSDHIVVIGSNSFSGSHFVSYALDNGYRVIGVSRSEEPDPVFLPYKWADQSHVSNFTFYPYDLNRDLDKICALIEDTRAGYVVNFASQSMVGQSWQIPEHWFMTNTVSTIKLHDRLRHGDTINISRNEFPD